MDGREPGGVRAETAPRPRLLRRSPLHACHLEAGARMVAFAGWEMPLSYPLGTVGEHRACRLDAAAFDVSHLGTVRVSGQGSFERLQWALTNDLRRIGPGRAQYSHLLTAEGWVADDVIVWWLADEVFDVMPNASNTERVRAALGGEDTTASRAVIAVQGPRARRRLGTVVPDAAAVARFAVAPFLWEGATCLAAGTGYTGEDGVECAVPTGVAASFWHAVLAAGVQAGGLGARDTLRLEAGLPLHGHELGWGITPLQAGLERVVGWAKGPFLGREALERERAAGPSRRLQGLLGEGRQPLRDGATVRAGQSVVGTVTSGGFSPMLARGIGLALLAGPRGLPEGAPVTVEARGRLRPAQVVRPPFWPAGGR